MRFIYLYILVVLCSYSCDIDSKAGSSGVSLFQEMPSSQTHILFENTLKNHKDLNIFKYRNFYNGGGVAIGDVNNDGLSDVFFTANMGPNHLYVNEGDFSFRDVSATAGVEGYNSWSTGALMVDVNSDGLLDIYVCNAGHVEGDNQKNELYINNGDLTFTEQADAYNLADNGFTTHAAFFDYDKDGDLDLYLLNNSFIPVNTLNYSNKRELRSEDWDIPSFLKGGGDKLLRNDNGIYKDVSEEAGIYGSLIGFGLGVGVSDVNSDTYPDIYVSNDFFERDYLYINNRDGTFTEDIINWTNHMSLSSMGTDIADVNNDGLADIYVTDMLPESNRRLKETSDYESYNTFALKQSRGFYKQYMQNSLQLNNGNNTFSEISFFAGVSSTDWSWSTLLFDMDNDGYKDIFVSNGIYHDLTNQDFMNFFASDIIQKMTLTGKKEQIETIIEKMPSTRIPNYAFKNNGDVTFSQMTDSWGLGTPSFSNGCAYGDLDNDGDLDLVVNNVNSRPFIYKNRSRELNNNNYVQIKLSGGKSNRGAIGAKVDLYIDGTLQTQELYPSRGFQSSVDYCMTFGLGVHDKIDSLHIIFPSNKRLKRYNLEVNSTYTFQEEDGVQAEVVSQSDQNSFFSPLSHDITAYKEDLHVDFNYEGLVYKMLSKEGPCMAQGDVNGDGYEDLFVGGAAGQPGKIYLYSPAGFRPVKMSTFEVDVDAEDTAAAFMDADGDGDLDILVGSGGNRSQVRSDLYALRLYTNDGAGIFVKSELALPKNKFNTAVIAPYDFDGDGDIDVFVGSRSIVSVFGAKPKHLMLENDGAGNFTNSSGQIMPDINQVGMITDATWEDVDGNGEKELVIVEDWGPISIFKTSENGTLEKVNSSLDQETGWWRSVTASDIDSDGDMDLILGNNGLNASYVPTENNPVKMYLNDFDNNGVLEQVFSFSQDGKDIPIHMKMALTGQLPSLKKQVLSFESYASKTVQELFSSEKLDNSLVREVKTASSIVAINQGNFTFEIRPLPSRAQFSCINETVVLDINKDGHRDIVYAGNDFGFTPQFSQLDGDFGGVLLGDGQGDFSWMPHKESGFFATGVVNSMLTLKTDNGLNNLIVGRNNDKPLVFSYE